MMGFPLMQVKTTRQLAALRQIHSAIKHFEAGEFECAGTLALAAESQLPDVEEPYLYRQLRNRVPKEMDMFNGLRNWLKHVIEPDEIDIHTFEVVIALVRATSKFIAVYRQGSPEMQKFINWCRENGHLSPAQVS